MIIIKTTVISGLVSPALNNDPSNIAHGEIWVHDLIISKAFEKESALKKIHAKFTRKNVHATSKAVNNRLLFLPVALMAALSFTGVSRFDIT